MPPLASCPRGSGFSVVQEYLAKEYLVSCRNHVLLLFYRRWYGLVRCMVKDLAPPELHHLAKKLQLASAASGVKDEGS